MADATHRSKPKDTVDRRYLPLSRTSSAGTGSMRVAYPADHFFRHFAFQLAKCANFMVAVAAPNHALVGNRLVQRKPILTSCGETEFDFHDNFLP
jgi:hypothetical protein